MSSQGVVSTGSCIAFSDITPATLDSSGYGHARMNWIDWSEVESLGRIGTKTKIIERNTVGDSYTRKRAVSKDAGTISITAANVESNPAQMLLQSAIDSSPVILIYCRLTLANGSVKYFKAYPEIVDGELGDADSLYRMTASLSIDGAIVNAVTISGVLAFNNANIAFNNSSITWNGAGL